MDSNSLAQFAPYLWLAVFLAGGALGVAAVFRIIDEIERQQQPKRRKAA